MPPKPSGEIKTRIVHNKRKNGNIYVLERQIIYDPEKKRNVVLSSRLISKIVKGTDTPVETRPKRKKDEKIENSNSLSAFRKHVGMMDIIDHIGRVSGIDDGIYSNTDTGTAQKILSLARYLLATDGQSLPGITTWQFNHPLPYEEGISEDIYHDLFEQIGGDESLQQNFFRNRCDTIRREKAVLAYDSTTISTYSSRQNEARHGFNKAHDGLPTIKLLTLYSVNTRQPVAFTKQPGNLADVASLENALKQLSALGIVKAEIVTDNGYYSEQNLSEMFQARFGFITLIKTSIRWVRPEFEANRDKFDLVSTACPFDPDTHAVSMKLMHDFTRIRKYASHKKDMAKGSEETFTRKIYLHLYFNAKRRVEEKLAFDRDILEMKDLLEAGVPMEEFSDSAQKKAEKYLQIRHYGSRITAVINEKACQEQKRMHGYFALVSNCEKDPFECLRIYRKRETVELYFKAEKQHTDGNRPRVWTEQTLRGRMFVQFVALCYYEYLSDQIRQLKASGLGEPNGDKEHDQKKNLNLETRLRNWLKDQSVHSILQWFDAVEEVTVNTKLHSKRWDTKLTERDRLFMDKLGVPKR